MIYLIFLIVCFIQSLLLSIKYFIKKTNLIANHLVALLLLTISLFSLNEYIYRLNTLNNFMLYDSFSRLFEFLLGPLVFLYYLFFTRKELKFDKKNLLHFLLPGIYSIVFIFSIIIYNKFYFEMISKILSHLSLIIYFILSLYIYSKYLKRDKISRKKEKTSHYLKIISSCGIGTFSFGFIIHFIKHATENKILSIQPENVGFIIFIIFLEIYSAIEIENIVQNINNKKNIVKYENNRIDDDISIKLYNKLTNIIEEKQLYKYPEITLDSLAEDTKIASHVLSQIINRGAKTNFNNFINKYRIEEVKRMMVADSAKTKTITEIFFDAGFNSKSTFNKCFKQFVKMSPSEYWKNCKKNQSIQHQILK